jgi:hypothetical protein
MVAPLTAGVGVFVEASSIRIRWSSFVSNVGLNPEPEYHRCYPQGLLDRIVELALSGIKATGLRIATKDTGDHIHALLNEAWTQFWSDPDTFVDWEKQAVRRLFEDSEVPKSGRGAHT